MDQDYMPLSSQILYYILCNHSFLTIAIITMLCCLFIILTFIAYSKLRKQPGDILLSIAIADFFVGAVYFANALYTSLEMQSPTGTFCQLSAIVFIIANTADFVYDLAFCLYLRFLLKNVLKKQKQRGKGWFHGICLFLITLTPLAAYNLEQIGLNEEFICSIKSNSLWLYFGALPLLIQIIVALITIRFLKKSIPTNFNQYRQEFESFYDIYLIALCISCTLQIAIIGIQIGNEFYFHFEEIEYILYITRFSNLVQPVILTIIRGRNPIIKNRIKQLFNKLFRKKSQIRSISNESCISLLAFNIKQSFIQTILIGITRLEMQEIHKSKSLYLQQSPNPNADEKSQVQFISQPLQLDQLENLKKHNIAQADLEDYETIHLEEKFGQIPMTVTQYAPRLFQTLRLRDRAMVNISESFDLEPNQAQIQQFEEPTGGKSGEFFFFSADNRLILKTITSNELMTLLSRLPQYADYSLNNTMTMLSIVYGIYSFHRKEQSIDKTTYALIQRNISQVPSSYILRIYDMKGSQFDREVKINESTDFSKVTLKDTNFTTLEQEIRAKQETKQKLKETLLNDINFLLFNKLMDYSLLVMKIDWKQYIAHYSISFDSILQKFQNPLQIIPSTEEPGVYYHVAIIDYLQEWTTKKKVERASKKVIYRGADVSAIHPVDYAKRFKENLIEKILLQ